MTIGVLPDTMLKDMITRGESAADPAIAEGQIQPASLDLRLGEVAYRIRASYLPGTKATVRDNVALALELSDVPKKDRYERADKQLALVGLADWADRKVGELSGGMQQRVGLARAFVTEAPILLMDEPFSALDPLIRTRLQDELLDLQRDLKRTIIFVSHDLDEAFKLGGRIAIMVGLLLL